MRTSRQTSNGLPSEDRRHANRDPSRCTEPCLRRRLLVLAAVPAASTCLGALLGHGRPGSGADLFMSPPRALATALLYYLILITAVRATARAIRRLARSYRVPMTRPRALLLTLRSAAPLLLGGLTAAAPWLQLHLAAGLGTLACCGYLVWRNVPLVTELSGKDAAQFSGAVMVVGTAMLIVVVAATVLLWDAGLAPALAI